MHRTLMNRLLAVGTAAALVVGLAACSPPASPTADNPTLTIGTFAEPTSFDPAQASEGMPIPFYQAVYDTLIKRRPDGGLEPMLATKWVYDETNTRLTLTLRDGVTFTDGSTFDSAVAKANIEHFQTANGPQANTLAGVTGVETPDATTLVLTLSAPDPALLIYLSNAAGFMVSSAGLTEPSLATTPVGSGPYTLDTANTAVGSRYTFVRKADYWGDALPYQTIVIGIYTDETARLNALKSGQVNAALFTAAVSADEAQRAGFTQIPDYQLNWEGLTILDRAGSLVPALADERVRQALNHALDTESMLKNLLRGRGTLTDQVWGPSSAGYDPTLDAAYQYDPEKAKALLAEAGYPDGFTFSMPNVPAFDPALMTSIQQQLAAVGVTVELQDVALNDFIGKVLGGQFPVIFLPLFQPSDWVLINQYIAPQATWNPFHTADPAVEQLIGQIQVAPSDESARLSQQLNALIVQKAWFVPFWRADALWFHDAKTSVQAQTEQGFPSIYNWAPTAR